MNININKQVINKSRNVYIYIHRSFSVTRRVTPNIHHGAPAVPRWCWCCSSSSRTPRRWKSSPPPRSARRRRTTRPSARRQKQGGSGGGDSPRTCFFWGTFMNCVCIYIYTVYIYVHLFSCDVWLCNYIWTFIYLFISILSYFVPSYPACQVICDRKCLFWSWIWIPHGDGSKLKTNLQTSAIRSTLKNTNKKFVQWFDPLF